ncbi:MAG: hypothetical protein QXK20_01680, partial [Nitrososphaerales archaeon]
MSDSLLAACGILSTSVSVQAL